MARCLLFFFGDATIARFTIRVRMGEYFLKKNVFSDDFSYKFRTAIQKLRKTTVDIGMFVNIGDTVDAHIGMLGRVLVPILFGFSSFYVCPEKRKSADVAGVGYRATQYVCDAPSASNVQTRDEYHMRTCCIYVDEAVLFMINTVSTYYVDFIYL